ncbi:Uma2 family endonuclease [Crocosphaera sp. XPORK-15E]|uniref:Uma2 family endonuclease n=1 Tax=Crocosphaera sp. XPORK-15E TaxID=3110247 RepID=UPI002B1FC577|nr:Uma2 family endonuclease [Crocosphaera sp. XPORK-15E]MEA5535216.1 Uma2 family endonuclease [Crocosphaera sp. XPORK-15E]
MIPTTLSTENTPLVLQISPALEMTDEQFFALCQLNRDYRIERNAKGELIIIPPTGSETGNRNFKLSQQLANWTDEDGSGIGFDSSTGFKLPNGADRSPDAAWMTLETWNSIPQEQRIRFAPVCPDFVVEIRSPSDQLQSLQDKLQEYIDNGAKLGWLIDRKNRRVYIYRPQIEVESLENPTTVIGDPILPGFILQMNTIW